jgi:hypothetical protein
MSRSDARIVEVRRLAVLLVAFACLLLGVAGSVVHAAEPDQVSERIAAIAGSDESVRFEGSGADGSLAYVWTFNGLDVIPDQAIGAPQPDLGIDIRTESIAGHATDSLVLGFAHEGALLAPATLSVALPPSFDAAEPLGLYTYDEGTRRYVLLQGGLVPSGGQVSFAITHCSTLILSVSDLVALGEEVGQVVPEIDVSAAHTPATAASATGPIASDAQNFSFPAFSWQAYVVFGFLIAVVIALLVLRRYRRARELAAMQQGWATGGALPDIDFSNIPALDDLVEGGIEEPRA